MYHVIFFIIINNHLFHLSRGNFLSSVSNTDTPSMCFPQLNKVDPLCLLFANSSSTNFRYIQCVWMCNNFILCFCIYHRFIPWTMNITNNKKDEILRKYDNTQLKCLTIQLFLLSIYSLMCEFENKRYLKI